MIVKKLILFFMLLISCICSCSCGVAADYNSTDSSLRVITTVDSYTATGDTFDVSVKYGSLISGEGASNVSADISDGYICFPQSEQYIFSTSEYDYDFYFKTVETSTHITSSRTGAVTIVPDKSIEVAAKRTADLLYLYIQTEHLPWDAIAITAVDTDDVYVEFLNGGLLISCENMSGVYVSVDSGGQYTILKPNASATSVFLTEDKENSAILAYADENFDGFFETAIANGISNPRNPDYNNLTSEEKTVIYLYPEAE